jgi:hypothetical protein
MEAGISSALADEPGARVALEPVPRGYPEVEPDPEGFVDREPRPELEASLPEEREEEELGREDTLLPDEEVDLGR